MSCEWWRGGLIHRHLPGALFTVGRVFRRLLRRQLRLRNLASFLLAALGNLVLQLLHHERGHLELTLKVLVAWRAEHLQLICSRCSLSGERSTFKQVVAEY